MLDVEVLNDLMRVMFVNSDGDCKCWNIDLWELEVVVISACRGQEIWPREDDIGTEF